MRHRVSVSAAAVAAAVVLAACGSGAVSAARGGAVEALGARLDIPPGALDRDAVVSLKVGEVEAPGEGDLLVAVSRTVTVDLGGATLSAPATLTVGLARKVDPGGALWLERGDDAERGPSQWVHAASLDAAALRVTGPVLRGGRYSGREVPPVERAGVGQQPLEGGDASLQVPFYWQAGWGWCSPTATSMTLNFFQPLGGRREEPSGRYSNTFLAGVSHQDASSGYWPERHLRDLGVPEEQFEALRWDADLIPSNAFTRYIRQWNAGFTSSSGLHWAPRPVQTSSDRNVHAFVITGSTADLLFINNSNDLWAGAHPSMSWTDFRDGNCLLRDAAHPAAGCSGDPSQELSTVLIKQTPRPEEERRGSLFLGPGASTPYNALVFTDNHDRPIARWTWDGDPYPNGYYFEDDLPGGALPHTVPADAELGRLVPRAARARLAAHVMNLTDTVRTYRLDTALLLDGDGAPAVTQSQTVSVDAFAYAVVSPRFEALNTWFGARPSPVQASFRMQLFESGVLQDVKLIRFHAGEALNMHPEVRITGPVQGTALQVGLPSTFVGYATDFEDGPNLRLSWSYRPAGATSGDVAFGTALTTQLTFAATGRYTVTFGATDSAGLSSYEQLDVEVVNAPPQPHLSAPGGTVYAGSAALFSGSATDANEPGGTLACSGLRWTVAAPDVASPATGCDVQLTFTGAGAHQVTLTATDRYGASASVSATVQVSPAPVNPAPVITALHVRRADGTEVAAAGAVNDAMDLPLALSAAATDADPLTYTWYARLNGGPASLVGSGAALSFTPRSLWPAPTFLTADLTLEVLVSDGVSTVAASRTVSWQIPPP